MNYICGPIEKYGHVSKAAKTKFTEIYDNQSKMYMKIMEVNMINETKTWKQQAPVGQELV